MTYLLGSVQAAAAKLGTSVGRSLGIVAQPEFTDAQRLEVARKAMIAADRSFAKTTEYRLLTRIEKSRAVIGALVSHYERTTSDAGFRYICNKLLVCLGAIFRYTLGTLSTSEQQVIKDQYKARFKDYLIHAQRTQLSVKLTTENLGITEDITDIEKVVYVRKPLELIEQYISCAHVKDGLTFREYALLVAHHGQDFSKALFATKNMSLIGKFFEMNIYNHPISNIKAIDDAYKAMEEAERNRGFLSRAFDGLKSMVVTTEEEPAGLVLTKEEVTELLKLHRTAEHTPTKLAEKITNAFVAAIKEIIKEEKINQPSLDQIVYVLRKDHVIRKTFESYPLLNIFVRGYIEIGYMVLVNNIEFYLNLAGAKKTEKNEKPSHSRKQLTDIFTSANFANKVRAHLTKRIDKQYVLDTVDRIVEATEASGPLYQDKDYHSLLDVVVKGPKAIGYEVGLRAVQVGLRAGLQAAVEAEYS